MEKTDAGAKNEHLPKLLLVWMWIWIPDILDLWLVSTNRVSPQSELGQAAAPYDPEAATGG